MGIKRLSEVPALQRESADSELSRLAGKFREAPTEMRPEGASPEESKPGGDQEGETDRTPGTPTNPIAEAGRQFREREMACSKPHAVPLSHAEKERGHEFLVFIQRLRDYGKFGGDRQLMKRCDEFRDWVVAQMEARS